MKMQDAGLDALSESVMRLGEMSNNISEELGQQNKMLESMETDLDNAGEELDIVTRSTKQLIAQSGGSPHQETGQWSPRQRGAPWLWPRAGRQALDTGR